MASFGPVARHYDLLMAQIPYGMWVGYFQLLLQTVERSPKTVLDVCCGTGTVTELLHKEGFVSSGVDISADMIQVAREKAKMKKLPINYWVQDVTQLDLEETFEGACSFFDSLNYITTLDGFRAAVDRVASHLTPGGIFIFDLNTSFAFEQGMFDQSDLRKKADLKYDWKGNYDSQSRIIRVDMQFWRDGAQFEETHVQRAHSQEEVVEALMEAGFIQIHAFDSYSLDPPNKESDRVHYLAILPA